jgi:hypothetical protein
VLGIWGESERRECWVLNGDDGIGAGGSGAREWAWGGSGGKGFEGVVEPGALVAVPETDARESGCESGDWDEE